MQYIGLRCFPVNTDKMSFFVIYPVHTGRIALRYCAGVPRKRVAIIELLFRFCRYGHCRIVCENRIYGTNVLKKRSGIPQRFHLLERQRIIYIKKRHLCPCKSRHTATAAGFFVEGARHIQSYLLGGDQYREKLARFFEKYDCEEGGKQ